MENSTEVPPKTKNRTTTPSNNNSSSGYISEENENTSSRRLLGVPWIARRSNQSILKEIGPQYCSSTLATRREELTHWKRPWCWERQRAGEGGDRDGWVVSWTQQTLSLTKVWETVKDRETWHAAVHGVTKSWTGLSDWTTDNLIRYAHPSSHSSTVYNNQDMEAN